jgi:hypothetical protein
VADTPTATELAYFAGFFDGEGSVGMYVGRNAVVLSNTDMRPLVRARELWSGSITTQLVQGRRFAIRDLHRWSVYGHKARPFLEAIRPFVKLKGEQIDVYLEALAHVPAYRGARRRPGDTAAQVVAADRLRLLKRGA